MLKRYRYLLLAVLFNAIALFYALRGSDTATVAMFICIGVMFQVFSHRSKK